MRRSPRRTSPVSSPMRTQVTSSLAGAFLLLLPACATGGGGSGPVPVRDTNPVVLAEGARSHDATRPLSVQVMMPDERVPCPFEALGTLTVRAPFVHDTGGEDPSPNELLTGIRAKLGAEAAEMGADAALVRHLLYDRRKPSSTGGADVRAVEAVLLRFVGDDCMRPTG